MINAEVITYVQQEIGIIFWTIVCPAHWLVCISHAFLARGSGVLGHIRHTLSWQSCQHYAQIPNPMWCIFLAQGAVKHAFCASHAYTCRSLSTENVNAIPTVRVLVRIMAEVSVWLPPATCLTFQKNQQAWYKISIEILGGFVQFSRMLKCEK